MYVTDTPVAAARTPHTTAAAQRCCAAACCGCCCSPCVSWCVWLPQQRTPTLHLAPLFHIGGISSALALLLAGGAHVFLPRWALLLLLLLLLVVTTGAQRFQGGVGQQLRQQMCWQTAVAPGWQRRLPLSCRAVMMWVGRKAGDPGGPARCAPCP